ncbi:hypothetical protein PS861_06314 [Pseudomonas fluorescens]|nr:hypothetical protein PS861_06314 [Pseudomonas fluorescens]
MKPPDINEADCNLHFMGCAFHVCPGFRIGGPGFRAVASDSRRAARHGAKHLYSLLITAPRLTFNGRPLHDVHPRERRQTDLAQESLAGSSIGSLGSEGMVMRQRLKQFLAGNLET